ncbi:putative integral membrane protein (TIGR02327 family) [Geomicrobium halophilum]|uniref:Putative integral membrane protein (TIGR02327 family) n=1 Tax=Geomicrobium halophilum TaxID=549000 RepID=A0A841PTF4_9BACL|nr:DUF1146 family protein [Geomicrobium halophilum]MBB6450456.1 putative integral membrane protein (TIGR02327 family) [Geomicrobium halophilum]
MLEQFGQQAILHILFNLFVLVIVWWSLQAFKFDVLIRHPQSGRGIMLFILVVIAITHLVSSFFLEYLNQALNLRHMF